MWVILLAYLAQDIKLEQVSFDRVHTFETNRYGHFLCDRKGRAFHWSPSGKLEFTIDRPEKTYAIWPVPGGYAVTWADSKDEKYGIDVVSRFSSRPIQRLENHMSFWFFELYGRLYGSADLWSPNETQIVPIAVSGASLAPSKTRIDFFKPADFDIPLDANYKRIWTAETDDGFMLVTPLEPVIHQFSGTEHKGSKKMPIPWIPWKSAFLKSNDASRLEWAKSFNRMIYFGRTPHVLVYGVELTDGKTTRIYHQEEEGDAVRFKDIPGWDTRGHILSGSDGARVWVFDPGRFAVYVP